MQAILDLGYGEQGRGQSDTREVGRGLYPKDNEELWRHFKKEEVWQHVRLFFFKFTLKAL